MQGAMNVSRAVRSVYDRVLGAGYGRNGSAVLSKLSRAVGAPRPA